jgi:hypothetical protein
MESGKSSPQPLRSATNGMRRTNVRNERYREHRNCSALIADHLSTRKIRVSGHPCLYYPRVCQSVLSSWIRAKRRSSAARDSEYHLLQIVGDRVAERRDAISEPVQMGAPLRLLVGVARDRGVRLDRDGLYRPFQLLTMALATALLTPFA